MTISSDTTPDHDAGKALAAVDDAAGVDAFVARSTEPPAAPRSLRARMLDYSAHAAMIVGLLGFAWTVGDHVVNRTPSVPAKVAVAAPSVPKPGDELADLRSANRDLADSVHRLQARLDKLQASVSDDKTSAQVHVLQAGLDAIRLGLSTTRSDQANATAQLNARLDKLQHDPNSKMQQLVDRLGRLEHGTIDLSPTASLPPSRAVETVTAKPVPRPAETRLADAKSPDAKSSDGKISDSRSGTSDQPRKIAADEVQNRPQVLASYVVRDVYDGVALIEGKRGPLEVVPGVSIPGAGIVKSIDRQGKGWTVTTTKGLLAYAAPPRDYRRAERNLYPGPGPGYRDDF